MSQRIADLAQTAIGKTNVVFALGIIENAFDETCKIVALPKEDGSEYHPEISYTCYEI